MKKVLKEGDKTKIPRKLLFECKHCGCTFICSKKDYEFIFDPWRMIDEGFYKTTCPNCEENCSIPEGCAKLQWREQNEA